MYTQVQSYRSIFFNQSKLFDAGVVLMASIVLALISQIAIPLHPVPLTFQSVTVIFFGLTMGAKRASAAVALYLLEGALGFPVFAEGHAGISVLFANPSAGYLWGFLPATIASGLLVERGMVNGLKIFAAGFVGTVIIFACGVLCLQFSVGWKNAFLFGVMPFVITEPVKLVVVSCFARFQQKHAR